MNRLKIGVRLESLGIPLRKALAAASKMGVGGVQFDAVGDLSPNRLSQTGRRELLHLLRTYDLTLTALGCPLRRTLDVAEDQQQRIEHVRKVMSMSFELGPRVAIVEAGGVPEKPDDPRGQLLTQALEALGRHGDRTGTVLALETGLESGATMRDYLATFDTAGLGVNLDPANLLLHGFDPFDSTLALRGRIVHAHAKDARTGKASRAAEEVPLGHGDIEWMQFIATLEAAEYEGWLVIERESGENRLADVTAGVGFLRRFVG
jgi:L-ribulose-5-phosphate 3-epimerase